MLKTRPVNCFFLNPKSSKALYMIVVEDIAIMPPRKRQSMRCQPKLIPTPIPNSIMQKIIVQAAMTAEPPTFTIFLKLNSRPSANNKNITPISAHILIFAVSITEGVKGIWGLARKPATTYPSTKGCFNFLNSSVMTPAQIKISARSAISVGK